MLIQEQDYLMHDAFLQHYGVPGMKWGHRKGPSTLDRYKKHKKTEKQYNEDLVLYGKKGAKRIANDLDNKLTLKGARVKEAGRFDNAKRAVSKGESIGKKVGANLGALAGYGTVFAGRRLASKIAKNGGKLNSLGRGIAKTDPVISYTLAGSLGSIIGSKVGENVGKRGAARKYGYSYKDIKKRRR